MCTMAQQCQDLAWTHIWDKSCPIFKHDSSMILDNRILHRSWHGPYQDLDIYISCRYVLQMTIDSHYCELISRDLKYNTPLHLAVLHGHLQVVKCFIEEWKCD